MLTWTYGRGRRVSRGRGAIVTAVAGCRAGGLGGESDAARAYDAASVHVAGPMVARTGGKVKGDLVLAAVEQDRKAAVAAVAEQHGECGAAGGVQSASVLDWPPGVSQATSGMPAGPGAPERKLGSDRAGWARRKAASPR